MSCRKIVYEDTDGGKLETIDVYLRIKPSKCEDQAKSWKILDERFVSITPPATSSALKKKLGKHEENRFMFTHIFGPQVQQQQLFEKCVQSTVIDFISGHNSLVFSYGTSNCGKTYTIQGTKHNPGIIPRALHLVFNTINEHLTEDLKYMPYMNGVIDICDQSRRQLDELKRSLIELPSDEIDMLGTDATLYIPEIERAFNQMEKQLDNEMRHIQVPLSNKRFSLWISFIEIYNEALYDLLQPLQAHRKQLKLAEDNTKTYCVKDLNYVNVSTAAEAYKVLMFGKKNLQIASTGQNKRSSRSHCIFTMSLVQTSADAAVTVSRLSICDLAGVERQKNTLNLGDRLKESQHINCSLHVLRRCFDRMRENQSRTEKLVIPYRESKLTKLFQKPLSGEGKVIMLVNVNPEVNFEESQTVMKTSAIARKVIISDVSTNQPVRKRPRSMLFTASLAEFSKASVQGIMNCDILDEIDEPTCVTIHSTGSENLKNSEDDNEIPCKKSKFMPCSSSAKNHHSRALNDAKNASENLLRKEVQTLKASLDHCREQNERMSAEIAELKASKMNEMEEARHNDQVKKLLEDMNVMKKSMQKTIDDKISVLREAFNEIEYYEKDISDLSKRNEKLEEQLMMRETKLDELQKQMSVNDTVLSAKIDKNEELEALVDSLQENVDELLQLVEMKDGEVKEANDCMRAEREKVAKMEKSCAALEKQLAAEKVKSEDLAVQFETLSKVNEHQAREILTLKEASRNNRSDVEQALAVKTEELNNLQDRILSQQKTIDELMKNESYIQKSITSKTNELDNLCGIHSETLQENVELKSNLQKTQERKGKMKEDYKHEVEKVEKLKKEVSTYNGKCKDLTEKIGELEKKMLDSEKQFKIVIATKDREIKNLQKVQERDVMIKQNYMHEVDQVEKLKKEVSTYNEKCKDLTGKIGELEKEMLDNEKQFKIVIASKDREIKDLQKVQEREVKMKQDYTHEVDQVEKLRKEVSTYNGKCKDLTEKIVELEKKMLDSEKQFKIVIASKDREIKDLAGLLENKKSTNEELKSASEELQRRHAALQKKIEEELHAKDKQIEEMKRTLSVCQMEQDLLEKECEHSKVYTREVEINKTTQYWSNITEMEELMSEKKSLETSLEEMSKSFEEESSYNSFLLSQMEDGKTKMEEMQACIDKLRRKNRRLMRQLDKLNEKTDFKDGYFERQLEKKTNELKEEKDKVEQFKSANEELKIALINCEEKFIEYEKKIESLLENNEKCATSSSMTYYKNEIEHLKYELSKYEEKNLKIQKTLDNTVEKFQQSEKLMQKNLEEKEQAINILKQYHTGEMETLKKEIKKLKKAFEEDKIMIEAHSLKEQNSKAFKKHLAEYQKEIVQFSKDADKFEEKVLLIESLKQNIDKKEAELKEATECLSRHLQENNNLKIEIAQMKGKFDQYVADMENDIDKDKKIKELTELVNQFRNEISLLQESAAQVQK